MTITTLLAAMIAASAPTAEPQPPVTPVVTTPPVKRYCIKDRRDGVVVRPKICRTREDWQARGFDPVLVLARN